MQEEKEKKRKRKVEREMTRAEKRGSGENAPRICGVETLHGMCVGQAVLCDSPCAMLPLSPHVQLFSPLLTTIHPGPSPLEKD